MYKQSVFIFIFFLTQTFSLSGFQTSELISAEHLEILNNDPGLMSDDLKLEDLINEIVDIEKSEIQDQMNALEFPSYIELITEIQEMEIRHLLTGLNSSYDALDKMTEQQIEERLCVAFEQSGKFYNHAYEEALKIKSIDVGDYAKELFVNAATGYKTGGPRVAISAALYTGLASVTYDKCENLLESIKHCKMCIEWDKCFDRYYEAIMKRRNVESDKNKKSR